MKTQQKAFLTFLTVLMLVVGVTGAASAVHDDGLFQLDYTTSPAQGAANVSSTNISPAGNTGDDWDKVYAGTSSSFAPAFVTDTVGTAETSFYTGGGSKDERPISTGNQHWEWDNANDVIPDKDDLAHAFAAAYQPTTGQDAGHLLFYFGADRYDTSGDAEVGFWFFRQRVRLGTKPDFTGEHQLGDILVLANWGGSNKVGDIAVYEWVGGNKPLSLLQDATQADCSLAGANDPVCAVVNNVAGETPPWPYTNKDGGHSYQATALFEGGIDLTDLLGTTDVGCFSSFLAATRSSHSTDAQLKDFALGEFPVCAIKVTKTGGTLSKIGDPVDYTIKIENTGHSTLYKYNISDTLLGAITTGGVDQSNPYVLTNTCGASLASSASCTITLRRTVQAGDPDPLPNTVNILYKEFADLTGGEFTSSDDHSVNLFQPAVMIEKTGDGLSKVTDPANYTFTITNMSSQDSPNLTLASISDNVIGDLSTQATAAGCDVLIYQEVCSFSLSRTVAGGDPDPLVNTVNALYHPVGFPNDITASDGHSVNLFQPSVSITKTGNELSKIGDPVTYHFKITNTSSSDSPNLMLDSISDDVLGDLASYATGCASLVPSAICEFDIPWTVAAVDLHPADGVADDPVINTVTIHFHPDGFSNDITATGSHELNLFQPSIGFSKTADTELSKATDVVNYAITLNNTSSPDTPAMVCSITDALLGVNKQVTLASGAGNVTNVAYTVQAGDDDPLVNNASVSCSPTGFPNVLEASDSVSVNLFQPSVSIVKSGPPLSKIDDVTIYHFKVTNTSSSDSPNLAFDSISDSVLGDLSDEAPAACDDMAPGAVCEFDVPWTVAAVDLNGDLIDDDPIINTVTVHYHPVGFRNDITDTDDHSLNLFQPSITFSKIVSVSLSKAGDSANYTLTLNNTSSADTPNLNCSITDSLLRLNESVSVASGGSKVITKTYVFQATDPDPFTNTANVSCQVSGFSNVLSASSSATVNLFQPQISLTKTGDTLSKIGDKVDYTITLNNGSSADTPDLNCTISDPTVGASWSGSLASGASKVLNIQDFTIPANAADPFDNTASATCLPAGFPNVLTASDSHSVNLFQPSVTIDKTGDTLSKVGDDVNYTIVVHNTSSADTPNLVCTLTDANLGINKPVTLASGASDTTNATYTVQVGDSDPLLNTASVSCSPTGFPNVLTASDGHSVNLFQPSITIDKTGDTLSKVGDPVEYTITVTNTSSADSPTLSCTLTDTKLGINKTFDVSPGTNNITTATYTVKTSDDDPMLNTASVSCSPAGFPNVLSASDSHSVNLFQPSVILTKTGPYFSKAGDTATYNITIHNTSSADSPNLVLDTFTDSVVAGVTPPAACNNLAPGASCSFSYTHVVTTTDSDPLANTATAHYHPAGFPNDIAGTSTWNTDLLHPAFNVSKVCKAQPVSQAGPAVFTITFNNTGDADLHVVPSEGAAFDVAAGSSYSYDYSINGPFNATVGNTVTGQVTLAANYNLSNQYTFSASGSCTVYGRANVLKTVNGQTPATGQTFTFELRQGASTASDGTVLETKTTDATGNINFTTNLVPGQAYQICEWVFPGWNTNLAGDGPLFVPNSIIPPSLPNPNVNNLTVCANFTVTSGQTRTFTVDNTPPPGGRALTIGFWKNWASCASSNGKGQKPMLDLALGMATATTPNPPDGLVVSAQNGGSGWPNYAAAYYLVLKGDPASTVDNIKVAPDCLKAVRLLDKSRIDTGKKMASDPLFNMTAQLIAAQLNRFMGAGISGATITNIDRAVLLNGKYKFNGSTYTPKLTTADANLANCLATQLDNYNNNRSVSSCP